MDQIEKIDHVIPKTTHINRDRKKYSPDKKGLHDKPVSILKEILKNKEYRPAIIYAPTRQKAEDLAEEINNAFPAAVYHAGLAPDVRDKVQASFLSGEIDAIVATIALSGKAFRRS